MEFEVAIYQLSTEFIRDYPSHRYPELMYKKGRPYSCLLIDLHLDYFICVPYRSSIHHKNAFLFSGTERSRRTKSGLDYSRMVLVEKTEYLDSANVVVDQDEYNETIRNIKKIAGEVLDYLEDYIHHADGSRTLHPREYARKYQYSTLPYFHDVMKI